MKKVDGIFFDEFGFDFMSGTFDVRRQRQNIAVDLAHGVGLPVVANGFRELDVFGSGQQLPGEPAVSTQPQFGEPGKYVDFYFYEDHQYFNGYIAANAWKTKANNILGGQAMIAWNIYTAQFCSAGTNRIGFIAFLIGKTALFH